MYLSKEAESMIFGKLFGKEKKESGSTVSVAKSFEEKKKVFLDRRCSCSSWKEKQGLWDDLLSSVETVAQAWECLNISRNYDHVPQFKLPKELCEKFLKQAANVVEIYRAYDVSYNSGFLDIAADATMTLLTRDTTFEEWQKALYIFTKTDSKMRKIAIRQMSGKASTTKEKVILYLLDVPESKISESMLDQFSA